MVQPDLHDVSPLLNQILPAVNKPARYAGGEWNARQVPWEEAKIRLALAYPDVYEVGMSNLGFHILYEISVDLAEVLCDRAYAPWPDMEAAMRARRLPLYGLESRRPLSQFDIIGFSLPYELNLTNVLNMLDLAGLPVRAADRLDDAPLVIAGGSVAFNPEPMADFLDLVVIGDGEEVLVELLETYRRWRDAEGQGAPRRHFLSLAAAINGVYVPSFYRPRYADTGELLVTEPWNPAAAPRVQRRMVESLPRLPLRPLIPYAEIVHDRAMIEIQRGCTQGCRFCQAGTIYRPVRERSTEEVVEMAGRLLANTGYDELGLLSLSSTDHSQIEGIVDGLRERFRGQPLSLSLPSLRIDAFSVEMAQRIQERRRSGLTFAPEAGSQRLRDAINKKVTEEDLLRTAEAAYTNGWHRIKLYFMIGLPTETREDVLCIAGLVRKVLQIGRRHVGRRAQVAVSVATFVPKPHTPFQWMPLIDEDALKQRISALRQALRLRGVQLRWHEPINTELEAVLARGDRRLGGVIERAWQLGARFDAWDEHFRPEAWEQAFEETGLERDWYARRSRPVHETLPWDHIDAGVDKTFLWNEHQRALRAEPLADCRAGCHSCGIMSSYDLGRCPPSPHLWPEGTGGGHRP